ncbi:hypothetical protein BDZ94DRAFT_1231203 [Collybia nuda]|uniref:Uncharacterized protein n=1 Tax=Collybia nuda TaxID=64659 RepID=A0A9P5YID0_9AGAR|nr:hypothetical protein BDZ94DRAFT_1231203 [Collybia nuda]
MNEITDKPDWHLKIFDDAITSKWRVEMLATKGRDITEKIVNYRILVDSLTTLTDFMGRYGGRKLVPVPPKVEARVWAEVWNMTLTPLRGDLNEARIQYNDLQYDPNPPQRQPDEEMVDFRKRRMDWIITTRKLVLPEPGLFHPPEEPTSLVDNRKDYSHRGLQIIVKLANIHLTPERPEYKGGTWHVEGQLNEHICATALYYYHNNNASYLAFRQQSDPEQAEDTTYEQDQHEWLEEIYGYPTKPGHHKILALFLVDPNIRIILTSNVPSQRKDWWIEAVRQQGGLLSDLPAELQDSIFDSVDFPIGLSEAKALRLELMEERTSAVKLQNTEFTSRKFSLCEH